MRLRMALTISLALVLLTLLGSAVATAATPSLAIGDYTLVGKTRVGLLDWQLVYRAKLANRGTLGLSGATARLTNVDILVVDGQLSFGPIGPGQSVESTDTFTLRWPIGRAISSKVLEKLLRWQIASTANAAPNANAGPDQTLDRGATAYLDGSASTDRDGDPLTYQWTLLKKPVGSIAALSNPSASQPSFVLDKAGSYEAQLVVNDGSLSSSPDTVVVSTLNSKPTSDAGANQTVPVGSTVVLDGSGSTDVDGNALSYRWGFTQIPAGSTAALSGANTLSPSFRVDKPGDYLVQLIVNDGKVDSDPASVTVSTVNSPPVARARIDADGPVRVGNRVTLDGSDSTDVDGDPLTYSWSLLSRPSGSAAALTNASSIKPSLVIDRAGSYTVQLLVNDGSVDSDADTVELTTENSPPVANAGPDRSGHVAETLGLDGTGSKDVDDDPLTFQWSLTGKPPTSTATLDNPDSDRPSIKLDKPGDYVAQLIVNDGTGDSAPDTATLSTVNSKPVADAGPDLNGTVDQEVTLDGRDSSDADGDALSFSWDLIARPSGSARQLTTPFGEVTGFTPDKPGDYVAQLTVNDGNAYSDADTAVIAVVAPPPPQNHPPQIASAPVTAATVGQGYRYDVDATDSDGDRDTLVFSLTASPAGMTIDPVSGVIDWTPMAAGSFAVAVQVSDGKGGTDSQGFAIQVSAPPPTVQVPNLVGLTQAQATAALASARLILGGVTEARSSTVPAGTVIGQEPDAGSTVAPSTAVAIVLSMGDVPPDPATVAPPIDPTVTTTIDAATQFLYSGSDPIQTGVAPGTIEPKRAVVIRGRVLDKANAPLPGVAISIQDHPELGQTLSRADGRFDMAVNGGGTLTLDYTKPGYLPAQRQIETRWQDYSLADDLVLVPQDSKLTRIDLTDASQPFQVAQGNVVSDADGTRQATLLIPQGTQAQVYNADGTTRPVDTLSLRLTEYTVGANGPQRL